MFNRYLAPLLALLMCMLAPPAQAFFDPPYITPAAPVAGEIVSINIRAGICDATLARVGYPKITQDGHSIRMVLFGQHYPEGSGDICFYPIGTLTRPIGAYAPGNYTLQVDLDYYDFFEGPSTMTIGVVSFVVAAPPSSISLPTLDSLGMCALMIALLGQAVWSLRKRRGAILFLFLVACSPFRAHAEDIQTVCVIPTTAAGAPTPAQIMAWVKSSPRSPTRPLAAFNTEAPLDSFWLIPDRATGDFRTWLDNNPNSARRKLEDCQLLTFAASHIPAALAALQADPNVASASPAPKYSFSSVGLGSFVIVSNEEPAESAIQYGWFDMNLDAAWGLAGGYSLVGQIDMGLYEDHPALRQFSGSQYVGGNFIKVAARDVGLTGQPAPPPPPAPPFNENNVDEKKAMYIDTDECPSTPGFVQPAILGHGTHTAGLIGANGTVGLNVQGTCKHCGIEVYKTTYLSCATSATPKYVYPTLNNDAAHRAQVQALDTGVQVLSASFGAGYNGANFCLGHSKYPECYALEYLLDRDVPMIAASGNERADLNFPASDRRVISAGGFAQNLALWDESPSCPTGMPSECGSNYTTSHTGSYLTHQEFLASSKNVLSTTYTGTTWVDYAECGDGYGTLMGDGLGWCTGTSMSAPQIAGVVGLLRSINPLVPTSTPEPVSGIAPGLRTVIAQTASRAQTVPALPWDPHVGYGIPNAAKAASRMLGTVAGVTVRNRVTPLFRLWEGTTKDFAATSSPQYALSLMINQDKNYVQPITGLGAETTSVPGYAFPYDNDDPNSTTDSYDTTPPATPLAQIYVLTTEYRSRSEWPQLIPLYLMDRTYPSGKDYMLATSKAEIETAYNNGTNGYSLRTIQGYIYQPCTPEPACVPPGAVKIWREFRTADNDCAVFLQGEVGAFEGAGYTAACPAGPTKMIGYAYPAGDSDGDGLPDALEYVIGTDPNNHDSDNDTVWDGLEFPLSGVPVSDPCAGAVGTGARLCPADHIFANGFNP